MYSCSHFVADIAAAAEPRKVRKRFSILVREEGSGREIELCQVDSKPTKVAKAAGMKLLRVSSSGRRYRIKRYDWIRIVDNGEAANIPHARAEEPPENAGTSREETAVNNLATVQIDDGWGDAAAETAERVIKGTLLKFSDWRWTKGKEGTEVEEGTKLVALGTTAAWVKWFGGKPIEYLTRQPGKRLPDREELSDPEGCRTWETGPDGEPKDPWQNTRFIYFVDPVSAEAFTFVTASWGGRQAVNDLAEQIQRVRYGRPGASPLVELRAEPWVTRFGRKSRPFFKVIDWRGGPQVVDQNGGGPRSRGPTPALVEGSTGASSSMDDEIPF
jgi:hypothetical protein